MMVASNGRVDRKQEAYARLVGLIHPSKGLQPNKGLEKSCHIIGRWKEAWG